MKINEQAIQIASLILGVFLLYNIGELSIELKGVRDAIDIAEATRTPKHMTK